MLHFKDFLIKLQTLDIKVIERKIDTEYQKVTQTYDISHLNPYRTPPAKNELREIKEHAITDLLNLSREQIHFQLERLKSLKDKFDQFWERYYHSPYSIRSEHNLALTYSLNLDDIFICPRLYFMDHAEATDYFLDDLESTIRYRQEVLREFEETILKIINPDSLTIKPPDALTPDKKQKGRPVFKEEIVEEFFRVVKEYFEVESGQKLKSLLVSNEAPSEALIFNGAGNQLADAFKQLFDSYLIVGCNKAELENWIREHFAYRDKGVVKPYTEKYLQDIISSNSKACQSPLFDVRKTDGRYYLSPLTRNNRNSKKS